MQNVGPSVLDHVDREDELVSGISDSDSHQTVLPPEYHALRQDHAYYADKGRGGGAGGGGGGATQSLLMTRTRRRWDGKQGGEGGERERPLGRRPLAALVNAGSK